MTRASDWHVTSLAATHDTNMMANVDSSTLPASFAPLPVSNDGEQWSPAVEEAHTTISHAYNTAYRILREEDNDPVRLWFHCNRILYYSFPLLEALETEIHSDEWVLNGAQILAELVTQLDSVAVRNESLYVSM